MESLLCEIGLGKLWPAFKCNLIGPEEVGSLSSEEFCNLGVEAIGDRIRIKQSCRNYLNGKKVDSAVVQQFIQLSSKGGKQKDRFNRKSTIGWKHACRANMYAVVPARKGGGSHIRDFERDTSLPDFKSQILDIFFPNGSCLANNMVLADLRYSFNSNSGLEIPENIGDKPFTVGNYCDSRKTSPIRIYLQTELKTLSGISSVSTENPVPVNTPSQVLIEPIKQDSDDDFVELGTPTVLLNRRQNRLSLSLKRRRESRGASVNNEQTSSTQQGSSQQTEQTDEEFDSLVMPGSSKDAFELCSSGSDSELTAAIKESLAPVPTFEEALIKWRSATLLSDVVTDVVINRKAPLESLQRAIRRKSFNWDGQLKVIFSGEAGEDFGGLKREFLSMLMKIIADGIGEGGSFQHCVQKLESNFYFLCGKCIVWSVLQGGQGCPFLNLSTFGMLVGMEPSLSSKDIYDCEVKAKVCQLETAGTEDEMPTDWLIDQGLAPPFTVERKGEIMSLVIKQTLYYRIHAELEQFRKGLCSFGFLDRFLTYREGLQSVLCNHKETLSVSKFREMWTINFSPEGSNSRLQENDTIYALELFLHDCCEVGSQVTLSQVLSFWTGSDEVPTLGFEKKLEIAFVPDKNRLPVAHTCAMILELPLGLSPEMFAESMTKAVEWGGEFHLY